MGTKKFSELVSQKIENNKPGQAVLSNDYLSIKTDGLIRVDSFISIEKIESEFVPALIYWGWGNTIKCRLDPSIPAKILYSSISEYGDSIKLREKLNGQKLELSVEQIPSEFIYDGSGNILFILVWVIMDHLEEIYPSRQNLEVSYRLLNDNKEIKSGRVVINSNQTPLENIWISRQEFTSNYLIHYNRNISYLGKKLIDKILTEI